MQRVGVVSGDDGTDGAVGPVGAPGANALIVQTELDASDTRCPGDGNMDYLVDDRDLDAWAFWVQETGGKSSWYDFNLDGLTDDADRQIIVDHLGTSCVLPDWNARDL